MISQDFESYKYDHLTHLQVGKIGEYWTKMWLTFAGLDIYSSEVDDRGIDFIIRTDNNKHIDIQVKTIREKTGYIFVTKDSWKDGLKENLYLALVLMQNHKMPVVYFIPSTVWLNPNELFKDKLYDKPGQKSKPEWGINISKKNMELLSKYDISKMVSK
ncbi:hypothetical protein [Flavobacterium caeni]|uniref:DUF4365 domain-containing protein n=1 Tax=Flavobacterium caeni TaxID=490189 RepID=A0A1G5CB28_9FLAO|nr:hypothetical protein [Flavobacterium caeni]SCX99528.1 hypothetical protein SAMN02927903_00478 [Flavobacterium caeni]